MKRAKDNPPSNQLPAGVLETDVSAAIVKSGYPLQVVVADLLQRSNFSLQQEWSYLDPDSGQLRAIDILAARSLYEAAQPQSRIRPTLDLVVECKQSALPYVLFETKASGWASHFPFIAGLGHDEITVSTDDDRSTWLLPLTTALDLDNHPFAMKAPYTCTTFSKCVRKGADLELSGSDAYSSVVLPILKAVCHFKKAEEPPETAFYFDLHVVVPVAVIDAAMLVATLRSEGGHDLTAVPWVRVYRHEYLSAEERWNRQQLLAVDFVHRDFLETYLTKHVTPFAERFGPRALKHAEEIAEGYGFAAGMGKNSWSNIESRLKPSPHARGARHKKKKQGGG